MNNHTPTTNPRVDAFARELALALRRITGRTVEASEEQNLPTPLPGSDKRSREENNGPDQVSSPTIA